jgi:hypothetical protein
MLLAKDANPWTPDRDGNTAFDAAFAKHHLATAAILETAMTKSRALRPITEPYGPIMGNVQLGMTESQLRDFFGMRLTSEPSTNNIFKVQRYETFTTLGILTIRLDTKARVSNIRQNYSLKSAVVTTFLLDRLEAWAGARTQIDIQKNSDAVRRISPEFTISIRMERIPRTEGEYFVEVEMSSSSN